MIGFRLYKCVLFRSSSYTVTRKTSAFCVQASSILKARTSYKLQLHFHRKMDIKSMKVTELRAYLKSKGASSAGTKETLVKRALQCESVKAEEEVNRNESSTVEPECLVTAPEALPSEECVETKPDEGTKRLAEVAAVVSDVQLSPLKRKLRGAPSSKPKKLKGPPLPKNPAMILHELKPAGLEYNIVSTSGLPHSTIFTMEVTLDGQKYTGCGSSKKEAKQNAAAAALGSIVQFEKPELVVPFVQAPLDRSKIDFTSDDMDDLLIKKPVFVSKITNPSPNASMVSPLIDQLPTPSPKVIQGKNPVMLLNEMCTGLQYACVQETGVKQSKVFTMQAVVNGNVYQGFGKSKKQGKLGAAVKALRAEFGVVLPSTPDQEAVPSNTGSTSTLMTCTGNLPDLVFTLIKKKFWSLTNNCTSENAKHKVLAGVVMTRSDDVNIDEGEVISLATGTKCVSGEYISDQGSAMLDCHAEIVSLRGLRRFLYQQLLAHSRGEDSVFEPCDNGGCRIKQDVFFHLYINTTPCGDARIFSPHDVDVSTDEHPNRKSRSLLRTKIENGEGTIPVEDGVHITEKGCGNVQQTWDALISGERLLTMSCSDKLAKCNVLGVQGSLLSLYIEPVYLSSIVIGALYHSKHFERGVFSRAKEAVDAVIGEGATTGIHPPYRVHRPLLAAVSNPDKRSAMRAPTFCLHWTYAEEEPSIVNTVTGRITDSTASSNLCKQEMMRMLLKLTESNLTPRVVLPEAPRTLSYAQLKNLATDHKEVKYILMNGFHKTSCGSWVGKPTEVDNFFIHD